MALLALLCMQKDEGAMLSTWFDYHCGIVDPTSIFVFDNGSTDEATCAMLYSIIQKGGTVIQAPLRSDFEGKGRRISALMRELSGRFDAFCPLDCDELLYVEHLESRSSSRAAVEAEVASFLETYKPLGRISRSLINIPSTESAYLLTNIKKTMVRAGAGVELDLGFHLYDWGKGRPTVPEALFHETRFGHLHFHHRPFNQLRERARLKLAGRVSDFSAESLAGYRGAGVHLAPYLMMDEARYLSGFEGHVDRVDYRPLIDGRCTPPF